MLDWIQDNKEWIFSGAGIAVVSAIIYIVRRVLLYRNRRIAQVNALCGHYEVFHYSTALPGNIIKSALEIIQDSWGNLSLKLNSSIYKYTGTVIADMKNITLLLNGDPHIEKLIIIFSEPLTKEFDILEGVFAAPTENGLPACGKMIARKVTNPVTSKMLEQDACDPKLITFLTATTNPILVPKTDPPLWDNLK